MHHALIQAKLVEGNLLLLGCSDVDSDILRVYYLSTNLNKIRCMYREYKGRQFNNNLTYVINNHVQDKSVKVLVIDAAGLVSTRVCISNGFNSRNITAFSVNKSDTNNMLRE